MSLSDWFRGWFGGKGKDLSMNEDPKTFKDWFDAQGFKHFSAGEFERYFVVKRYGVQNSPPDRALWGNILPTLRVVDELRGAIGQPVTINSSYRSPVYNKACGGAKYSQHLQFSALDISVKNTTPHEVFTWLEKRRSNGAFKGGLGLYNTFVHIDTRGTNATW